MPRPQFTLRALLVLLVAGCFFGGVEVERERQKRDGEAADLEASQIAENYQYFSGGSRLFSPVAVIDPSYAGSVRRLLDKNRIESIISGSDVSVPLGQEELALSLLRKHGNPYRWVEFGREGSSATHE